MRAPHRVATLLLEKLGGAYGEALGGDLLEELRRNGAEGRFWREIFAGVAWGLWRRCGEWLRAAVFAVGWSLFYPLWREIGGEGVWTALAHRSFAMDWPYSSVGLLASAGLPPLLFVWCGALLYMARNYRPSGWGEGCFCMVRGLSLSLSVLLVSGMVLLSHTAAGGISLGSTAQVNLLSGGHLPTISLPVMLSLLSAVLAARPRRMPLRSS